MGKVTIHYNPIYIKKLKDIKGHGWDPEKRCWFFPKLLSGKFINTRNIKFNALFFGGE